jgi:hypothetical protein
MEVNLASSRSAKACQLLASLKNSWRFEGLGATAAHAKASDAFLLYSAARALAGMSSSPFIGMVSYKRPDKTGLAQPGSRDFRRG